MTMTKIETVTVGSGGAANITFSSIPQGFTDLQVVIAGRSDTSAISTEIAVNFNGSTYPVTGSANRYLYGNGSSTSSSTSASYTNAGQVTGATATSNTFGSSSFYVPNYTSTSNKSLSIDAVTENNATGSQQQLGAGLHASTSAVTSMVIACGAGSFVQYSTASLYGILKGSGGATVS